METKNNRIQGYEFQADVGGELSWVRLQGNGGQMGNGLLFAGAPTGPVVEARLLRQAQNRLKHAGALVLITGVDFPIGARLKTFKPDAIVAVRAY